MINRKCKETGGAREEREVFGEREEEHRHSSQRGEDGDTGGRGGRGGRVRESEKGRGKIDHGPERL